jgi:hypothetical protein
MQRPSFFQTAIQTEPATAVPPLTTPRCGTLPTWPAVLAIIIVACTMAALSLHSRSYLGNNDAFYYLSIADNWLENGVFLDGTTIPDGPVITPQNGIVGIFALLRRLSLTKHQCLLTVLGLNSVLLLSCFYPLIKLCRSLGVESRAMLVCILLVFVGHLRIFMWVYLSPVNDMIFFTGQLWLVYLLAVFVRRCDDPDSTTSSGRLLFAGGVLLAAVLVHFRLNIVLIPLGGIAAALLTRRFRLLPPMVILLSAAAVSLSASWLVVDRYDFQVNAAGLSSFLGDFKHQVYVLVFRLIPESLFKDLFQTGNLLYLPFYAALLVAFFQGVRRKNVMLLLVVFVCLGTFAMTALHGNITERYLWAVTAFLYILLFRIKLFHAIGVLFVTAVLINSLWLSAYEPPQMAAWQNLAVNAPIRGEKPFVLAKRQRECWYYTGLRSVFMENYTWQDLTSAEAVYLIGPQDYVEGHLKTMRELGDACSGTLSARQIGYWIGDCPDLLLYEVTVKPATADEPRPL